MHENAVKARRYHPVAGVVVAVCLVCTVLFIVGDDSNLSQPIVHEEVSRHDSTSASTWLSRVKKVNAVSRGIKHDKAKKVKALQTSESAAIRARKIAVQKQHESNQLQRKLMRKQASKAAKSQVAKALAGMMTGVRQLAKHAAKKAAKATIPAGSKSHRVAAAGKRKGNAESKLEMLEKDVALLNAASAKAKKQYQATIKKFAIRDAHYKALVNAKVLKAKHDFLVMKKKLSSYKGAKSQERKTAVRLRRMAQLVVRLSERLKRLRKRLKKKSKQRAKVLERWTKKVKRKKASLTRKKKNYEAIVKGLQARLAAVRAKKDVNALMASRISAEQGVVLQQEQKLAQANALIKRLKKKINGKKRRWRHYVKKAKKRKQVLRIAHQAYTRLERAVSRLKAMAAMHGHTVVIKAPHASAERNAKRLQKALVKKVKELGKKSRAKMARRIERAAARAAAARARAADKSKMNSLKLRGLNQAMAKAKSAITGLKRKPKAAHSHHGWGIKAVDPLKNAKALLKSTRKTGGKASIKIGAIRARSTYLHHKTWQHKAHKALRGVGHVGLIQQPQSQEWTPANARRYRTLSHVAHRLYSKALKTRKDRDILAAKVAMRRVLAARRALEH